MGFIFINNLLIIIKHHEATDVAGLQAGLFPFLFSQDGHLQLLLFPSGEPVLPLLWILGG